MVEEKKLLIAEDDEMLRTRLGQAMERRGFTVMLASSVSEALQIVGRSALDFAVIDLKLGDGDGLQIVEALRKEQENARSIILSGYANIATAVSAVKAGAIDYLPKPSDADAIEQALMAPEGEHAEPPNEISSVNDLRLEHIESVFKENDLNVSETARRLNMHRRTLQRILLRGKTQGRLHRAHAAAV